MALARKRSKRRPSLDMRTIAVRLKARYRRSQSGGGPVLQMFMLKLRHVGQPHLWESRLISLGRHLRNAHALRPCQQKAWRMHGLREILQSWLQVPLLPPARMAGPKLLLNSSKSPTRRRRVKQKQSPNASLLVKMKAAIVRPK
jgi:hypothetical protein